MRSRSRVTGGTTTTTIALAPASGDDDDADDDHHHDHDHYHDHDDHHHHNHRGRDGPSYRIIIQRPAADGPPPTGRRTDDCDIDGHGRGGGELLNDRRRRSCRTLGYCTGSTKTFDCIITRILINNEPKEETQKRRPRSTGRRRRSWHRWSKLYTRSSGWWMGLAVAPGQHIGQHVNSRYA